MNIDFNEFFRLRIDVMKVNDDMFRLTLENVYLDNSLSKGLHNTKHEYQLNAAQLAAFRNYVNEATHDLN